MTGCCARDYERLFSGKQAARGARRFRRRGLRGSAKELTVLAGDVRGASVLEVGGGVGGIEIDLLEAGAAEATNVELASTYEAAAAELLDERGLAGRVDRRIGDFVAAAGEIDPHDVVVLHRVVCCYPDLDALLGAAADRTRRTLLLTYPQDRLLVRLLVRAADRFLRARGSTFQVYVHPVGRIEAVAAAHGLRPQARVRHGVAWESAVFAR